MDVHSGYPFWLVKNGLLADYPALDKNLLEEEIVIIGSGISGALAAFELYSAGFQCTMVDKRLLSAGSTWASTAQLNYEIDSSIYDLTKRYNEAFAVSVYEASLASVHRVMQVAKTTDLLECMEPKSSLYLASDKKGEKAVMREYKLRRKHNFPVELFNHKEIETYRIKKGYNYALYHQHALQLDAYRMTVGLIQHCIVKGNLKVYTRTCIEQLQSDKNVVTLKTDNKLLIKAKYVVCAPGYESQQFLPKQVMNLNSTYALVTQPIPDEDFWKERCLIWESMRPYFYLRTTSDNRIMMGGEDEKFKNPQKRDALLDQKREDLLTSCRKLFPHLQIEADFVWCGTFGETNDGLPYIGKYPGMERVFFALGYGGNGTTYSMIAAEVICNALKGIPDHRAQHFGFDRH